MTFTFRSAVREQTHVLIALAGASGSGKTFSALRLARGLVGDSGKIAMIDTEARRGLHYADAFKFDHLDMTPPFTPERIVEAAEQAVKAGYHCILIDSASDEYEGMGGLQDIQHDTLVRMATDRESGEFNARRAEALTAPSWKDAKMRHQRMMAHLRQMRAHVIFCLRAQEKVKFEKVKNARGYETTQIIPMGFQPICEKSFMYDMTASFLLVPDAPGLPQPIKLQEQHKLAFPPGKHIDEASGQRLAAWARGGSAPQPTQAVATAPKPIAEPPAPPDDEPPPPEPMDGPEPPPHMAEMEAEPTPPPATETPKEKALRIKAMILKCATVATLDSYMTGSQAERHTLPQVTQAHLDKTYHERRSELLK